jgi:hypothetical protein
VLYLRLIILSVGGDVPIDSETLLLSDFVNLKIKLVQSFGCIQRGRVYVRVFIEVSDHMYMSIYIYTVFLKKVFDIYKQGLPMQVSPNNQTYIFARASLVLWG